MSPTLLPQWHSFTTHGRIFRRHNGFFHSFYNIPGLGILCSFLVGLIFYMAYLSPHGSLLLSSSTHTYHLSSSPLSDEVPSSLSDVLSLEQIRDIVATTRGFFTRDYSLNLGWNNVSKRGNLIF